ncbi:ABC transporter permease [Rhizobium sp. Root149]|uniref:TRAP transporter small permease n=1 Tax=Rhizobium sp. Root149 TaxID=1736473 RepID=UPI0007152D10|nr:TRAP transporter small permease [Rhizobium sp. Root149]KQZ62112.1 ABC transporter permease [Rhizobium sp. Root149]
MQNPSSAFRGLLKLTTDVAAGVAVTGVLIVVLIQVASRMLGVPVSWTEEGTRYLFVWMIFLGLAAGFRTVETARVVVLLAMMPGFLRRLSVPIYVGSCLIFFGLMGWTGWLLVRQQYMMNETAATLAIPMWLIGIVMPLSAILGVLGVFDSLRNRRDFIALDDPAKGTPELNLAEKAKPMAESNS